MSRWRNKSTGAVVSVADEKDGRFEGSDWEPADESAKKSTAKPSTRKKD